VRRAIRSSQSAFYLHLGDALRKQPNDPSALLQLGSALLLRRVPQSPSVAAIFANQGRRDSALYQRIRLHSDAPMRRR